jgi:hypothetical protein
VLKDSLVLDVTTYPDFAQVESDEPQTTVNRRFEVFFPEKRQFFTENSSYFEVPMITGNQLLFTRRIANPDFGARLTGKLGRTSIGALVADDRLPGETVPRTDPLTGSRAYFGMLRVSRDLARQSNIGASHVTRQFEGSFNRVADVDGTFRLGKTWTASGLLARSWSEDLQGNGKSGTDIDAKLLREGRGFNSNTTFTSISPSFRADAGYIYRTDFRTLLENASYSFWPQSSAFTKITAGLYGEKSWFASGGDAFGDISPLVSFEIKHQTTIQVSPDFWYDVLRPRDCAALSRSQRYFQRKLGVAITSSQLKHVTVQAKYWANGTALNYIPPPGEPPKLARWEHAEASLSLLAAGGLTIKNTYLFDRNRTIDSNQAIYNSHIFRTKWNWQLNREFSLRFIVQYNALLTNPLFTSAETARSFNADFLITYLIHPGTAIYAGYNSDLSRPGPAVGPVDPARFVNDGRQFFVKASYLFRF